MTKPRHVFDSTPLIYLAKTSLLEAALESCEAYTTKSVMKETTENTDYPDAITIKDSVERGKSRYTPRGKRRSRPSRGTPRSI